MKRRPLLRFLLLVSVPVMSAANAAPHLLEGTFTNEEQVYFDGEAGRKPPAWFALHITRDGDQLTLAEPDAFGAVHSTPHSAMLREDGETLVLDYGQCQRHYRRDSGAWVASGMGGTCRAPGTITRIDARAITLSFPDGSTTELRRARPVTCWVALRKHTPKADGSEDWLFQRGVRLHDQGGRAMVGEANADIDPVVIRVRNVTWEPGSTNHPVITLYVHKPDKPARAESYSWAAPDSSRIGINLRWMQAGCTVSVPGDSP